MPLRAKPLNTGALARRAVIVSFWNALGAAELQGYNEMVGTFYALHGLDAELYGY